MSNSGRRDFLNPLKAIRAFREESTNEQTVVPEVPLQGAQELDENSLLYVSRPAMACTFQIYFSPNVGDQTETAVEALDLVEQLENQMTVYRDSPLTYLNEVAMNEPLRVESGFYKLLKKGIELHRITDGAFDMTSGLLTKAWGFFRKQGRVPTQQEVDEILLNVGSQFIEIDDKTETLFFRDRQLEINLGGIGKGHALDCIAKFMVDSGLEDFLIHGGQSSVLGNGFRWKAVDTNAGNQDFDSTHQEKAVEDKSTPSDASLPWKVGLIHPLHPDKRIAVLSLHKHALGTSGTARQSFYHRGKRYGHIIDPRTGFPAEGVYSATALAPTAAEADALATAFYVMGGNTAVEFCRQHPQYSCLILSPARSGEVQIHRQGIDDNDIEFTDC